ncbi:MAG: hypothetical protein AXW12_19485 [Thalassospira sp. Nap_22]|nr:MAG: hypothetical protein AXW12_19485 [Thalassospira sp. Nap_22]
MLEVIEISDRGIIAKAADYPVFITPDELKASPFLFSREVAMKIVADLDTGLQRIECSLQTTRPLEHALLTHYGCRAAVDRYNDWWTRWHHKQEDSLYLGEEPEDINLLLFSLEVTLGRRFCEPQYLQV